jgi:hypothetical protein
MPQSLPPIMVSTAPIILLWGEEKKPGVEHTNSHLPQHGFSSSSSGGPSPLLIHPLFLNRPPRRLQVP